MQTATFEPCGVRMNKGVTALNIELERQKLYQTDARNIRTSLRRKAFSSLIRRGLRTLTDFQLLFHAAEKYEAGKDKYPCTCNSTQYVMQMRTVFRNISNFAPRDLILSREL